MKFIIRFFLFPFSFFFLLACPTGPGGDSATREIYQVDSLEVTSVQNRIITVTAYAIVPNPCHDFDHMDVDYRGRDIDIRLFSRYDKEEICITVLGELTIEQLRIPVGAAGEYRLHFGGRESTLDTTVVVP